VFEPNYRGSDNLGEKYMQAIWNDAGDGPGRDVMAGIKKLEQEPWIDSSKESVAGWSYGGFMTTWLIGHEHRWKCAVAGAAVTDWMLMRTLGDAQKNIAVGFKGDLWAEGLAKDYAEQSPISYASKIVTPTLILADTGDQRVPTAQSFILYNALKSRGIETKFVLYPAGGHFPSDPVQSEDVIRRICDWLEKHGK
jgi:dipeptidyl aminopeptidase/acylaminoacyl peptidase